MSLSDSLLVQTFREAMRIWDAQKAEGISRADRVLGLAQSLKAAWPKGREEGWKYLCTGCSDYGLEMHECPGDATCGRDKPHLPHEFGTPCWCSAGKRFKAPAKTADDFTGAGTVTRKPKQWSRGGR